VLVVSADAADDVDLDGHRELVEIVRAPLRHRRAVALVRPDGYLAAVGTAGNVASIENYLSAAMLHRVPTAALLGADCTHSAT
jgi:hypothetical protein